jgi:hypothetical protein
MTKSLAIALLRQALLDLVTPEPAPERPALTVKARRKRLDRRREWEDARDSAWEFLFNDDTGLDEWCSFLRLSPEGVRAEAERLMADDTQAEKFRQNLQDVMASGGESVQRATERKERDRRAEQAALQAADRIAGDIVERARQAYLQQFKETNDQDILRSVPGGDHSELPHGGADADESDRWNTELRDLRALCEGAARGVGAIRC